jgi:hypothetical protein
VGVNKTLNTVLSSGADSATPVQPFAALDPGIGGQMHQYSVGASLERTAIDVAGPFTWSEQGN